MRRKVLLVVAVLVLVAMGVQPVLAITGGEYDDPDDPKYPQVGAMVVETELYGTFQACSGTLIHPRVFLTAGHCTSLFPATVTFWVNFDTYALNEDTLLAVEEVITHPDYHWGPTSNPHDVGVLILAKAVADITPANLPSEGFLDDLREEGKLRPGPDGSKFTVVGYGATLDWPPPHIYYEDHRQYAVSEFQALLKSWLELSQNQATGDGGACIGDSGGPAFWTEPDGTEILVGTTSWGDGVCVARCFRYRVDTPDTLDFIQEVIEGLD